MIKIKVKSIWQGCVAIRDKYYKEAIETNQSIQVTVGKESYLIENPKKYAYKSNRAFKDKFSGQSHFLYYYTWKPAVKEVPKLPDTPSLF